MGIEDIIEVLVAKYSLYELEERLDITLEAFNGGLESFVLDFREEIEELLEEDGWLH